MNPFSFFLDRYDSLRERFQPSLLRPAEPGLASPDDFIPYRSSLDYWKREASDGKRIIIQQEKTFGVRWHHGPLYIDGFYRDPEPKIEPGPRRLVIWQPTNHLEKPRGWIKFFSQMNARMTGYAEVGQPDAYWKTWTEHAQRHRKKWLKEERFYLEEISGEEFMIAYRQVKKLGWLRLFFIDHLKSRIAQHGSLMHFFVARDTSTRKIVSGLAVLDIPEIASSLHVVSFIYPEVMDSSVGVGLIDYWFQYALAHHITFLDFDLFWAPGDPREWKGFSRFKSQFGTKLIRYPHPFLKFVLR